MDYFQEMKKQRTSAVHLLGHPRRARGNSDAAIEIPTCKLIQQGMTVEQGKITNREIFGTWRRPSDFTLSCIGYMLGIHNFFKFPFLCYRYGGIFLLPFTVMLIFIGMPAIFLEFTIGQYYSVEIREAFGQMAPILKGLSLLLSWNSLITCVLYTSMITWLRVYSGVSTSCLKPWENCHELHYYNTLYCYTGADDDNCNDVDLDSKFPSASNPYSNMTGSHQRIYFNFKCVFIHEFCEHHGWEFGHDYKCYDRETKKYHSIYNQRMHGTNEYFYGGISGMERVMEEVMRNITKQIKASNPNSTYTTAEIRDILVQPQYTKLYWTKENQQLQQNIHYSIGDQMKLLAVSNWVVFFVLLFEGLLSMTVFSYILNGIPFLVLGYMTFTAATFQQSVRGIKELLYGKGAAFLWTTEIWVEAAIQAIITTGVGNGVLISLASFNKLHHSYLYETFFTVFLNVCTSICAVIIVFSTIGHYLDVYRIQIAFYDFIPENTLSGVDFGYIVYTYFFVIISENQYTILMFFFMISSFVTDSCLKLVQNSLDTLISIFPRLRPHSTATLVGICSFGVLIAIPSTKSGAIKGFIDYEYFTFRFVFPFILFLEIAGVAWIYGARRLLDDAKLMQVNLTMFFYGYMWLCLKIITPLLLVAVITSNVYYFVNPNLRSNFRGNAKAYTFLYSYSFVGIPVLMAVTNVIDQLARLESWRDWRSMFSAHEDNELHKHHHINLQNDEHSNQLDLLLHHEILNTREEAEIEEKMIEEIIKRKSHKQHGRSSGSDTDTSNVSEKVERRKTNAKNNLNKAILQKYIFLRDNRGKLKLNHGFLEKLLFITESEGGTLKFRKDIVRKLVFRKEPTGKTRMLKSILKNLVMEENSSRTMCIDRSKLERLVFIGGSERKLKVNKTVLQRLQSRRLSNYDEKGVNRLQELLGLVDTTSDDAAKKSHGHMMSHAKISINVLQKLVLGPTQPTNAKVKRVSPTVMGQMLLIHKSEPQKVFVEKNTLQMLLCTEDKYGRIMMKMKPIKTLIFESPTENLVLNNDTIRTAILKPDKGKRRSSFASAHEIRTYLMDQNVDAKLRTKIGFFKKFSRISHSVYGVSKKIVNKLKLRKRAATPKRCEMNRNLLGKLKRKGTMKLNKHAATKLKLMKYYYETKKEMDPLIRLNKDKYGLTGERLVELLKVLKYIKRSDRKVFRSSSVSKTHGDNHSKIDRWFEGVLKHFEEWPGRLDDSVMDSDYTDSDEENQDGRIRIPRSKLNNMTPEELEEELKKLS